MMALRAFGLEWLVFRDNKNTVAFVGRYCCHMGADLSRGKIVDGCIECPLHAWKFDSDGVCTGIPALDGSREQLLQNKKLASLPVKEAYGLIFVFYGENPDFDISQPRNMSQLRYGTSSRFVLPADSHVPCLNTFDLQHYKHIHQREFLKTPEIISNNPFHLGIEMDVRVVPNNLFNRFMFWLVGGEATICIDCWGASLLLMTNHKTGFGAIIGLLPVQKNLSSVFVLPIKNGGQSANPVSKIIDTFTLGIAGYLIRGFLRPDLNVLSGMKPFEGKLVDGLDDTAKRYWDYYRSLPSHSVDFSEK